MTTLGFDRYQEFVEIFETRKVVVPA